MYKDIDYIAKKFIENPTESDALNLMRCARTFNLLHLAFIISKFCEKIFPHSIYIKEELALISYFNNDHNEAYDANERALSFKNLHKDTVWKFLFNQHFSINDVCDRFIYYDKTKVDYLCNRRTSVFPLVTLTITTCKRFDLFEKTINSVINCFDIDKIDEFFCVDDGSSQEDIDKMTTLYPFIHFYWKKPHEKGHPRSMNIIRDNVTTPYIFHLEDDMKFFVKRNYIADALSVLGHDSKIGQCLFNKNYAEIESDIDVKGGIPHTTDNGIRYFIHEFTSNQEELEKWKAKYGACKSSSYWPHFSLRPSLIRTSVIKEIGVYDEIVSHFEMQYASRYVSKGYVSAFFEGIYHLHIGRLTSERNDLTKLNAYQLNNECQFVGKEEVMRKKMMGIQDEKITELVSVKELEIKTYVLNLDRRPDRWKKFKEQNSHKIEFLEYERFSAVDGTILKNSCQLQQIFENNDYNMRPGLVGCLLSHVKMFIELINSIFIDALLVIEDDASFTKDFETKYKHILQISSQKSWDLIFLGHHLRDINEQKEEEKIPEIEKYDVYKSFTKSLGGTHGYLITKKGAQKLLDFINETGSTNGIDTLMQKSAKVLDVYYCSPQLIYAECFRGNNTNLDTDIQYNYDDKLVRNIEDRIHDEIQYFGKDNIQMLIDYDIILQEIKNEKLTKSFYFQSEDEAQITNIKKECIHKFYCIGNNTIFVICNIDTEKYCRYYHRFQKNNQYNIDDILK